MKFLKIAVAVNVLSDKIYVVAYYLGFSPLICKSIAITVMMIYITYIKPLRGVINIQEKYINLNCEFNPVIDVL